MSQGGINFRFSRVKWSSLIMISILLSGIPAQSLPAQINGEVVIANRYANIRSGPGIKYARLGKALRGDRFPVTDIRPKWYEITYKNRNAWVYSPLVRFEEKVEVPTQQEIDQVTAEIEKMNGRVDSLLARINEAGVLISQRYAPLSGDKAQAGQEKGRRGSGIKKEMGKNIVPEPAGPAWAFVPGGARLAAGYRIKGLGILAATAGCLAAGFVYHNQYLDYRSRYGSLPPDATPLEFCSLYDKADMKSHLSNGFFYAAAGMYALNILDYFFFLPHPGVSLKVDPVPQNGQKINLSLSCSF
jgi:hypothetical protein